MTLAPLRTAVADVERLAGSVGTPEGAAAYGLALETALAHDAWDADRRATVAAARLGLDGIDPQRHVGTLSGGQRTRLALATIMTTRPACLLLDEPTNHLDDDAIEVLSEFLRDLPGVVVLASHDRVLLDDVCTDLVDLDAGELGTDGSGGRRFGGGWTAYEAARADARRRWEETYAVQQEELARLRDATRIGTGAIAHDRGPTDGDKYIYSFKGGRVDQTLARRKKDAQRRLDLAEREQVRKPPAPLRFRGDLTTAASGRLVQVRDVEVEGRLRVGAPRPRGGGAPAAHRRQRLRQVDAARGPVRSARAPRAARSTSRRAPSASSPRTRGSPIRRAPRWRRTTPRCAISPPHPPCESSACCTRATTARRSAACRSASGGGCGLAVAIAAAPDLLLLDEPTNHVSLALAGELEEALATAPGGIVLASHDRWLRRRWEGPELALVPWA